VSRDPIKRLREQQPVDDNSWDDLYPGWVRDLSRIQWTPVTVARKAAAWLVDEPGTRVLDVGSGVGKLCLIGALCTDGNFTGVEQRTRLVTVANAVARRHSIKRCTFVADDAQAIDWSAFSAWYLYNPFSEHLPGCHTIDEAIPRSPDRYRGYVQMVEQRLDEAATGTRLVTYYGFGGEIPFGWEQEGLERMHGGLLELWVKRD
jgi:SAM-dependent methyltransferase